MSGHRERALVADSLLFGALAGRTLSNIIIARRINRAWSTCAQTSVAPDEANVVGISRWEAYCWALFLALPAAADASRRGGMVEAMPALVSEGRASLVDRRMRFSRPQPLMAFSEERFSTRDSVPAALVVSQPHSGFSGADLEDSVSPSNCTLKLRVL